MAEKCKQMEDLRAQSAMEKAKEMALELYAMAVESEKIAKAAKVSVEQINAWIAEGK